MKTAADAVDAASYLFKELYPDRCEAIGLFGSIARHGSGNDIDLVLFVPLSFTARQFLTIGEILLKELETPGKAAKQRIRQEAARRVLGIERLAAPHENENGVDVLLYHFCYDFEGAISNLREVGKRSALEAAIARDLQFFIPSAGRFIPAATIFLPHITRAGP